VEQVKLEAPVPALEKPLEPETATALVDQQPQKVQPLGVAFVR
jgi:hypothetical protein